MIKALTYDKVYYLPTYLPTYLLTVLTGVCVCASHLCHFCACVYVYVWLSPSLRSVEAYCVWPPHYHIVAGRRYIHILTYLLKLLLYLLTYYFPSAHARVKGLYLHLLYLVLTTHT